MGILRWLAAIGMLMVVIMLATSWMPIPAAADLFAVIMGVGLVAGIVLGLCGMVSVLVGGLSGGGGRWR